VSRRFPSAALEWLCTICVAHSVSADVASSESTRTGGGRNSSRNALGLGIGRYGSDHLLALLMLLTGLFVIRWSGRRR
jgi:hypothetical protein